MLFGLWYVLGILAWVGSKLAAASGTQEVMGEAGGSERLDGMEWEWDWEMAMHGGKEMKTSRSHVPIRKGSVLHDLYLWWPAWWELRGHECAERALPVLVIHPLKSQPAQSSAVCGAEVKMFG